MLSSRVLASLAAFAVIGTADGSAAPAAAAKPLSASTTCGGLKEFYKTSKCCGSPSTAVKLHDCPYNFNKPLCENAEVQAPRDLSTGASGSRTPKAPTLTVAQQKRLPLTNVHYHLGAEHKSDAYSDDTDSKAFDATAAHRRLADNEIEEDDDEPEELGIAGPRTKRHLSATGAVRPGFFCKTAAAADEKDAYTFKYCKNVEVGKTYEIHYVHSSAGHHPGERTASVDGMDDGLGGAAHGRNQLNPMVVVQGLVVQVVNKASDANLGKYADIFHGWGNLTHTNAVMYPGSTTGPSHDNKVCSPYTITWHVDKDCHKVSAETFDNMCKTMKETYKMAGDLYPHGSRTILDPKWVVPAAYVKTLA